MSSGSQSSKSSGNQRQAQARLIGAGGKITMMETLYTDTNDLRSVVISASITFMTVYMDYKIFMRKNPISVNELAEYLIRAKLKFGVDRVALEVLADLLNSGEDEPGPIQVARGRRPRPGRDGRIEFLVKPTVARARYDADSAGNIDFKELNLFDNAYKGQEVARMLSPEAGIPGVNVFGQEAAAENGSSIQVHIGKGILANKDYSAFYADMDGRLEFDNNRLSINNTYEVQGDVDYKVGNIDFIGEVIIRGSVLDDFNIKARRGITIQGNVGGSKIQSAENITIHGGITGRQTGLIKAERDVQAKYLNDVTVQCRGDVLVKREVVGSIIRTHGRVYMEEGSIIGGMTMAYRGISVKNLGSSLGVQTSLLIGIEFRKDTHLLTLERSIMAVEEELRQMQNSLSPYADNMEDLLSLSDEDRAHMRDLIKRLRLLRTDLENAYDQQSQMAGTHQSGQTSQINVHGKIHPGTLIRTGEFKRFIDKTLSGPLSIVVDPRTEQIRVVKQIQFCEDKELDPETLKDLK